jgi:hypothetical protein
LPNPKAPTGFLPAPGMNSLRLKIEAEGTSTTLNSFGY